MLLSGHGDGIKFWLCITAVYRNKFSIPDDCSPIHKVHSISTCLMFTCECNVGARGAMVLGKIGQTCNKDLW